MIYRQEGDTPYLPIWAWCYLIITGIIFICTVITLCYTRKWLCFGQIVKKQWCDKNSDSIQKDIHGYVNKSTDIMCEK
ncbi:unnamed protein product [Heterobilharzia americana]|nr:unnamed protein product [Heterobilharzia americana]